MTPKPNIYKVYHGTLAKCMYSISWPLSKKYVLSMMTPKQKVYTEYDGH